MKSIQEMPPVLTVHRNGSEYFVRVHDLKDRPLVVGISKLLEGMNATSLVLITPNDMKVFALEGSPEEIDEAEEGDPTETAMRVTQAEEHPLPNTEVVRETGTKVVRRPRKESVGVETVCGRCAGLGRIQTLMDGGAPAETACPICQGEGTMKKFGGRKK